MNMIYRECITDDFEKLLPLFCQLWPDQQLTVEKLKKVFIKGATSDYQYYLCAETDGKIVGFCSLTVKNNLWQQGNLGHIDELVVDESFRRRGIGKKLLIRIIKVAQGMGCRKIELDSAHNRTEAHEFYGKNGFENRAVLFSKHLHSRESVTAGATKRRR